MSREVAQLNAMQGPLAMMLERGEAIVWPDDGECHEPGKSAWVVSKWAACYLAQRGTIRRALFPMPRSVTSKNGRNKEKRTVEKFLERVRSKGVTVEPVRMGIVRVYAFSTRRAG